MRRLPITMLMEAMDREIALYQAECNALETKWMSGNFA